MPREPLIICGLICAILASVARGERATTLLDGLETTLQAKAAALADDDTKVGKKALKTATQALKKLGKDTTSELGDVKLLKRVSGALLKRFADDAALVRPIVDAADAVDTSIDADLVAARALIPVGKKVTAAKVTKGIDRAQKLLDKSRAKTTKSRIAVLFKARKAADRAVADAGNLEPETPELDATLYLLAANKGGTVQLLEIETATGNRTVVDTGPGEAQLESPVPARAPDGAALAFQQGARMVFVDVSDGNTTTTGALPNADWEFSLWSPDSTTLVAAGTAPDTLALFDRQASTLHSSDEQVLRGFPIDETFRWSRNGEFVAFRTDRNGDATAEVRVLSAASGEITEVSASNLSTDQIRFFAWSRLSDRLIYAANVDRGSFQTELVVVNADGTGTVVVSQAGQNVKDFGSDDSSIKVSPVAETVLYEFVASGSASLATVGLDGADPNVIASAGPNFFGQNEWSPDGSRIAYIDRNSLYSCNPDGTDTALITDACPDFLWAPDGSKLIYRDGDGFEATTLFVCDPDGADPLRVSPSLGARGNVEDHYLVTATSDGLLIQFTADADVNDRPDQHIVQIREVGSAPAKKDNDSTIVTSQVLRRFDPLPAGYEVKKATIVAQRTSDLEMVSLVNVVICDSRNDRTILRSYLIFFGTREFAVTSVNEVDFETAALAEALARLAAPADK